MKKGLRRLSAIIAAAPLFAGISGCGFQPLYATAVDDQTTSLTDMRLVDVAGREVVADAVADAFARRGIGAGGAPRYDLRISVRESARPLAVQIDATVTRFTYEISGNYILNDLSSGQSIDGAVRAQASFNIVTSQYSTLVAERAAREKAARQIITQIERDALVKLSRATALDAASGDAIVEDDGGGSPIVSPTPRDPSVELIGDESADVWREYSGEGRPVEPPGKD